MTVVNINDVKLSDEERQPCEVWTRVMGYLRPVSEFNKGKKNFTPDSISPKPKRSKAAAVQPMSTLRPNSL